MLQSSSSIDEDDDIDSIDGDTDDDILEEDEHDPPPPTKIVAKIKEGTIMNNRGQFLSKSAAPNINNHQDDSHEEDEDDDDQELWLDEARANRKIADLEIEKQSLLSLNSTLEATVRRQTERIAELEKRLQMLEAPPTPVSEVHEEPASFTPPSPDRPEVPVASDILVDVWLDNQLESDQIFQRLRVMVQNLIEQAQTALLEQHKLSGRVLVDYNLSDAEDDEEFSRTRLVKRHTWPASPSFAARQQPHHHQQQQQQRMVRRVSDVMPVDPRRTLQRSLSRQSSPPVVQRATPKPRKTRNTEQPKWHF
ncbi:hypothetical protein EC973_008638 [Apophysomyces ossiformis]|uniref:Uncharacterized protein n=1 Tax=Apophysomyces ossiformis TaxID=679940 RepID=A0A8H7EQW5_9FUNG|nr:hypothetical protein EC973_008638 [Apophysomyces ossiformis]